MEPRALLATDLVISEFLAQNVGNITDEDGAHSDWLEIRNVSGAAVNLAGWSLTDDAAVLTKWQFPAENLPAGSHRLVWASDKNRAVAGSPLHTNFKLSNNGEYLALVRPGGTTVEHAYSPKFPEQYADISYGLSSDLGETGYFQTPTPGAINAVDPTADPTKQVVISEIMFHPSSELDSQEYIELYNRGTQSVDLAGWKITQGVTFNFPLTPTPLAVGGRLVVAANLAAFAAKYPAVSNVVGGWIGSLANGGEDIELQDSTGERIDLVSYSDQGDWATRVRGVLDHGFEGWDWRAPADGLGRSLELVNPALSNNSGQNWAPSLAVQGTPGTANGVNDTDIAPIILNTTHAPVIPRSTDPITVTARIVDEQLTGHTVQLHWRVDGAGSFTTAAMFDDGAHGDSLAGDGTFGAIVPAQANGTVIEYYVSATDATANTRTWPGPAYSNDGTTNLGQVANALLQVDNAFDPLAAWVPGSQPIYRLIMTAVERAELADIGDAEGSGFGTGEAQSDAQMNGTFVTIDGTGSELRYNVGIRNRGHGSRIGPPNNYRVNIPHDDSWKGVSGIDINSRYVHSNSVGYDLFQLAGLVAPDAQNVEVRVNGVDLAEPGGPRMFGSYVAVEAYGSHFADNHFPKDSNGNIYRAVRLDDNSQQADLRYEGTDPLAYQDTYFKDTNEELNDWSDLINLTNVLNNAPTGTYLQDVAAVANIDQWLRYIALDALLLNQESGLQTGIGDDYLLYRGVTDPRFVLMPHDLDSLFQQGSPAGNINANILAIVGGGGGAAVAGLTRLFSQPEIVTRYYQAVIDLIADVFNPTVLNPLIDRKLGGWVPQANIDAMKQFVVNRSAAVLAQIPRTFSVTSTLPIVSGYHLATTNQAVLNGAADASQTESVLVGGVPAAWDPRTGAWSISTGVTLNKGLNRILVQAFSGPGGTGQEVSRGYLDILYGTGTTTGVSVTVATGSTWRYLDNGSNQGTAWRAEGFADGTWATGPAQLGYGEGDEATVVSFGGNAADKYETTYFRRTFTIPAGDAAKYDELTLQVKYDDGVSVFINGTEVVRQNLPGTLGDNTITYTTLANGAKGDDGQNFESFTAPVGVLHDGTNTIAVEIHQNAIDSSDISFDFSLFAREILASGTETPVSGTLAGNTVWTPAASPYHVTGTVTIPAGSTLTIQPGTTVYFDAGTQLTVNGALIAQGNQYQRIRMTSVPGAALVADIRPELPLTPPKSGGIQLIASNSPQNIISYLDIEDAQSTTGAIGIRTGSQAIVDNVTINRTHQRMVYVNASSVIVRNSTFPNMFGPTEEPINMTPPIDNSAEHIKGEGGIPAGGHFIIQGNVFGTNKGHNDVIDVDSNQLPNPILQILDNVFLGTGDENYDGGGDYLVEGNLFQNVHKDLSNNGSGDSNAMTSSDTATTVASINRNTFVGFDHAVNFKLGAYGYFENNTVVDLTAAHLSLPIDPPSRMVDFSVMNFLIPNETDPLNGAPRDWPPGKGAYTAGNIYYNIPQTPAPAGLIFGHVDFVHNNQASYPFTPQVLELHKSLLPRADVVANADGAQGRVFDYLVGDPRFVNAAAGNYALGPGSPAKGTGPNGLDMGAAVPGGASISGEPPAVTSATTANLVIGGPGIFSFDWRLDGGPWQPEIAIRNPRANLDDPAKVRTYTLPLAGLAGGTHHVDVRGRNFAGVLQSVPTVSKSWTVDTALRKLVINEVLANNVNALPLGATRPDAIELYNAGAATLNLADMSLSDNPANPRKFIFPAGTLLAPGQYLVVFADALPPQGSELHTGFALSSTEGEGVWLFDTLANGGIQLDAVEFGMQIPDLSIGRIGHDGAWTLNQPTLGTTNIAQRTGNPATLKINEWLAASGPLFADDFIELYNPDDLPVDLGGLYLTDDAAGEPTQFQIAPLSFVSAGGYAVFLADDNGNAGHNHTNFHLSADHEHLGLFAADGSLIDQVIVGTQTSGVSQGRAPDGGPLYQFFTTPTPGLDTSPPSVPANVHFTLTSPTQNDLAWNASSDAQSGVAFYNVYRNGALLGTSATTTYSDLTVTPGGLYSYRVSAVNGDGFESAQSPAILTGTDNTPPSAPTNLDATIPSLTQIDLTWSAAVDPETGVSLYRIYRNGALIGTSATTSYSDTTVAASISYYYEISALNVTPVEGPKSVKLFVTKIQDTTAGGTATGTIDGEGNQNSPTTNYGTATSLNVDGDTTGGNDDNIFIKWDLSGIPADHVVRGAYLDTYVTNISAGSYNLSRLTRNWAEASATWNEYSAGNAWQSGGGLGALDHNATVLGTLAATTINAHNLNALAAAGEGVVQSWIDANDGAGGLPNYGFLIHNTSNTDGVDFASSENATIANRPRFILIHSEPTPIPPDVTPPSVPAGLAVVETVDGTGNIDLGLSWAAASDPESGIAQYKIYKNGVLLATSSTTNFTDDNVSAASTIEYRVSAVNGALLESAQSAAIYVAQLQNGAGAYNGTLDTWINENNVTQQNGDVTTVTVDGDNPLEQLALLRWDVGSLPLGAQVARSSLVLNVTDHSSGQAYELYPLLRSFIENQATFQLAQVGVFWQTPGARGPSDRGTTILGSIGPSATGRQSFPLDIDGRLHVQQWITGLSPNYGMVLSDDANPDNLVFSSSEATTTAQRPLLLVVYTVPPPADPTPPSVPTNLAATDNGFSQINLTWTASSDPQSGVSRYDVYRDNAFLGYSTAPNYVDVTALPGIAYSYQVTALNGSFVESARSGAVAHTIPVSMAGRTLAIATRDSYLPGIPILVRVEIRGADGKPDRTLWDAGVTLSSSNPAVTLSATQVKLYNGLGSLLVTPTGNGPFTLNATIGGVTVGKSLADLTGQPQTNVSGTLAGAATTWSGIVHITGDVTVPVGHVLSVNPGTLVLVDGNAALQSTDGKKITVLGTINSLGTAASPVTFTASNPNAPWGEIFHNGAAASQYLYTDITRAGHSPDQGHTFTGPALHSANSTITFDHANISDIAGKIGWVTGGAASSLTFRDSTFARATMGPEIDDTALSIEDHWLFDMLAQYREDGIVDDDDGIYLHSQLAGQNITLRRVVLAHGEDDSIDTLGSTITVEDAIIRDWNSPLDDSKGISVSGGGLTLRRSLLVNNTLGVAAKALGLPSSTNFIDRSTIVENGVGIERTEAAAVTFNVTNSIVRGLTDSIFDGGQPASVTITYSDLGEAWPGTGNITADPQFVDAPAHNYNLLATSPAIDAGDPAATADPDGTRADMGAFPYLHSLLVTNTLDSGLGSLRQAMLNANAAPGTPTIEFAIPGAGPHVIGLASNLPNLTKAVQLNLDAGEAVEVGTAGAFTFGEYPSLTKLGAGSLVVGGAQSHATAAQLVAAAGTLTLASDGGPQLTVIDNANVVFGATQHLAGLQVGAGATATLATGGGRVLVVASLAINPTGKLDLSDNDLVVQTTAGTRNTVLAAVTGYVTTGASGLAWDGPGINSSAAASDAAFLTALGVMLNDNGLGGAYYPVFSGQAVNANSILVKYTYYGDADVSGTVDGTDYALIDNGFNGGLTGWFSGDFNYASAVDGTDYALIDNAFNSQGGPLAFGGPAPGGAAAARPRASTGPAASAELNDLALVGWEGDLPELVGGDAGKRRRGR